jgi:hypothetical protein
MGSTAIETDDKIRRAFVNLKAVRDNLGTGYVHQEGLYKMFNQALDELQQAGMNISEWRMPHDAVGNVDTGEFRARIDAILMYFTVHEENRQIGFRR